MLEELLMSTFNKEAKILLMHLQSSSTKIMLIKLWRQSFKTEVFCVGEKSKNKSR